MEKMWKTKKNAGLTLLEVIVAVSIFSVAALVLLQGFVLSGRINRTSALYMSATDLAQNVMEDIKSKDFAELSTAFNYPVDADTKGLRLSSIASQKERYDSGEMGIQEIIKDGDQYKNVRKYRPSDSDTSLVTASVISEDNGRTYKFNARTSGKNESRYYFEMTNVKGEKENYDVLAEFDGSKDSGYKKSSSSAPDTEKNDYLSPNITKLDTKTNAFLIMPKNWDDNAMNELVKAQHQQAQQLAAEKKDEEPAALDPDEVYKHTKRTLYVRVEESSGTIKAEAKYTLNAYDYVSDTDPVYGRMDLCPKHSGTGSTESCTYESAYTPFYSSETGEKLKSIYVFYYPNYNSTSSVNPLDEIVFENTGNFPVNLYVTKQRDEGTGSSDDTETVSVPTLAQENNYRMSLTVRECPDALGKVNWNTNPGLYRAQTALRTNLDYNISDPDRIQERSRINQMKLTYQAVSTAGVDNKRVTGSSAKKVLSYNGLDDRKATDRIYKVKVSIYKAGAAARNFPESDLICTLDGAKEQ